MPHLHPQWNEKEATNASKHTAISSINSQLQGTDPQVRKVGGHNGAYGKVYSSISLKYDILNENI